ncbi:hypothetical protein K3U93_18780 [Mycobacterium malmoense]|nr:hypothetical protein [Mycobacterium malmoense]QZA16676.1 hypothetical protein K3U93_18780 [Mycobacterium malmoense]UNB93475.1 hypothetical protein H5T25_18760 [Mycobacterium malmoense]
MDLAARPHITAGVTLASAAVIAVAPATQHLPDLRLAQQLPQVSVSDIQLTDAATGVIDLFSGVESELASLASGASAAAVPAAALTDFINPAVLPLPLATWVNTFQTAGTNLQYIFGSGKWSKAPFPVLQQVAANWVDYANIYVGAYQQAATNAVNYLAFYFGPLIRTGLSDLTSGNISGGINALYTALFQNPIEDFGLPLEKTLEIPAYFLQNLASATQYAVTIGVTQIGLYGLDAPYQAQTSLGLSLQAAYNAWNAGNPMGALSSLLNTPGATVNGLLNGSGQSILGAGLLSSPAFSHLYNGLVNTVVNTLSPTLAGKIVAPGAVNIETGGSLSAALQSLVNQLVNGWPSLSPVLNNLSNVPAELTSLLQSIPSVLSNLPSILGKFGGALVSNIGLLISNLLKLL